ncbi:MAG: ATP-binding protein [Elusimicrobia bacterium]|nr:ATP-binding protein [Elusimicrobiota bacterium]
MNKDKIIELLAEWNFWDRKIDTGIPRKSYLSGFVRFVKTGKVVSVVGVRRSGKSTLMKQTAKELIKNGTSANDILIVNFEEPQFESADLDFLIRIYQAYLEIIRPAKKPFLFLDEIQNVEKWEKFVRSINEKKQAYIMVSGSSSKLLSEELASVLTGRQIYFEVLPLSFREFLKFRGIKSDSEKNRILNALKIKRCLREYLRWGGFPEIVLNKDEEFKKRVLISYYQDIISRDIVQRFRIKKPDKLRTLVQYYLTNISSYISFNRISKFIKLPVETVRRFSFYIENSFLVFFVKRFSYSVKEQENSARKVYSIDTGLHNAIGLKFSQDIGRLVENAVALKLRTMQRKYPFIEFFYWKSHHGDREVDFVVKEGRKVKELIQVCWDISDASTEKREISSLLKAMKVFKLKQGFILTEDREDEIKIKNKKIIFKSLWKWLADESNK